jgi:hypothetical protein
MPGETETKGFGYYETIAGGSGAGSNTSASVIRVLVMCVWTPEVPSQVGPAPLPPAMVDRCHFEVLPGLRCVTG